MKLIPFIANIATYHVQRLTLQYYSDNGSILVECRFAERSTADGCHVIFRESSKVTMKYINITKSSIKESRVYQYITLPVSGNYTVTAHDIVDGTVITNPSVVYPQLLEYILLVPSPTKTIITTNRLSSYTLLYNTSPGITSSNETVSLISDITSTTGIMNSVESNGKLNNIYVWSHCKLFIAPRNIYLISGILVAVVILLMIMISMIAFVCIIVLRRRTLNEGMWSY